MAYNFEPLKQSLKQMKNFPSEKTINFLTLAAKTKCTNVDVTHFVKFKHANRRKFLTLSRMQSNNILDGCFDVWGLGQVKMWVTETDGGHITTESYEDRKTHSKNYIKIVVFENGVFFNPNKLNLKKKRFNQALYIVYTIFRVERFHSNA